MKTLLIAVVCGLSVTFFCQAQEAAGQQKIILVKIVEKGKKTAFELMTQEKFKEVVDAAKMDASLLGRAVAAAEQEWKKDETFGKAPFPRAAVSAREVVKMGEFIDQAKADDRMKAYEDLEVAREDALKKKEQDKKPKDEKKAKEAKKKEAERDLYETRARDMVEIKLVELKEAAKKAKEAKPEEKAAKPEEKAKADEKVAKPEEKAAKPVEQDPPHLPARQRLLTAQPEAVKPDNDR